MLKDQHELFTIVCIYDRLYDSNSLLFIINAVEPVLSGNFPMTINSFNPSFYTPQDFWLLKVVDEPYPGFDKERHNKTRLSPAAPTASQTGLRCRHLF